MKPIIFFVILKQIVLLAFTIFINWLNNFFALNIKFLLTTINDIIEIKFQSNLKKIVKINLIIIIQKLF